MGAFLARRGIRSNEEAAKLFFKPSMENLPIITFRLAAFLEVPLRGPPAMTAYSWLHDPSKDETHRLAAVAALARGHDEKLQNVVQAADQLPAVRVAALTHARGGAGKLLESWATQPAAVRTAALEILTASSPAVLLEAIKAGKVSAAEVPAHLAAQLRRQPGAEAILPPPPANRQAVIAARQGALKLNGDAAAGRVLFISVCATCHRDGKDGAAVGPDRVSFRNQGKPTLMQHILDPNREVAPRFFTCVVTTAGGETFAGIVAEESPDSLRLLMPAGLEKVIPRAEVKKLERSNRSLMPEGVEAAWSDAELADLLAFLVE